jgi:hypothetical protein
MVPVPIVNQLQQVFELRFGICNLFALRQRQLKAVLHSDLENLVNSFLECLVFLLGDLVEFLDA